MSHFKGKDARHWLAEEQPQLDEVKRVAEQLASALAYAHEPGGLHRDIKLSNILVQTAEDREPPPVYAGALADAGAHAGEPEVDQHRRDVGLAKGGGDRD